MNNITYISLGIAMFVVLVSIVSASPALFDNNTNSISLDQLRSITADGMKAPGERAPGNKTDLFDNNKNYMELNTNNGAGGTGVVPGNILNALVSFGAFGKGFDPIKFSNNFTATTKPVDKGPTKYLADLLDEVKVSRDREKAAALGGGGGFSIGGVSIDASTYYRVLMDVVTTPPIFDNTAIYVGATYSASGEALNIANEINIKQDTFAETGFDVTKFKIDPTAVMTQKIVDDAQQMREFAANANAQLSKAGKPLVRLPLYFKPVPPEKGQKESLVSASVIGMTVFAPPGYEELAKNAVEDYGALIATGDIHANAAYPLKVVFSGLKGPDGVDLSKKDIPLPDGTKSHEVTIWGKGGVPQPMPKGTLSFPEYRAPTEMKGGAMERSEMMTSTGIPNTGASPAINVPVGHEELINSYQKVFDSMPLQLKSVMRQGRVWFASSGHGEIQGTVMDYYKGDVLENAVADLTVNGINGVPQPISRGDLAYTLTDMLDQTYGEFSKPHGLNGGYDAAVNNDFAANPATPKYVTPAAADWESTHFGEDSQYSEDFKESVQLWVTKHSDFAKTYPNRSRWLDVILNSLL